MNHFSDSSITWLIHIFLFSSVFTFHLVSSPSEIHQDHLRLVYFGLGSPDFISGADFCGLLNATHTVTLITKVGLKWAVRSEHLYVIFLLCSVFWGGEKSVKLVRAALASPLSIMLSSQLSLQWDSPFVKGEDAS